MPKHAVAVFGADAVASLQALLNNPEYEGPGVSLVILKNGDSYYLRVQNADGDDPGDINDSHPCPGSPGCP